MILYKHANVFSFYDQELQQYNQQYPLCVLLHRAHGILLVIDDQIREAIPVLYISSFKTLLFRFLVVPHSFICDVHVEGFVLPAHMHKRCQNVTTYSSRFMGSSSLDSQTSSRDHAPTNSNGLKLKIVLDSFTNTKKWTPSSQCKWCWISSGASYPAMIFSPKQEICNGFVPLAGLGF